MRHRAVVRGEPNVTPMIDVMLVLLIIFMLVTPALAGQFVAEPPTAANLRDHPDADEIVVQLDAAGRLWIDRAPVAGAALEQRLRAALASRAEATVFIVADARLDYGRVRAVLHDASGAGARVAGLVGTDHPR